MTRKLLFTVTAAIALAGCSEGSPLEPQYAAGGQIMNAPLDVSAAPVGAAIEVRWTEDNKNERRFEIQRRVGLDEAWADVGTTRRNVTTFTDMGVDSETRYRYRVRACALRECSAWTTTLSVVTPQLDPSLVAGLTTTVTSSTSVTVGWLDGAGDETHFELSRRTRTGVDTWDNWETIGTPGVDATSAVDSGLTPDTGYRYRVRECNVTGCSAWVTGLVVVTPAS